MEHCHNNLNTVKAVYDRRTAKPDEYQALATHAAECRSCARNLRDLQENEFRQLATPKPVRLKFDQKERQRR